MNVQDVQDRCCTSGTFETKQQASHSRPTLVQLQAPPPPIGKPLVSNVAARSVDVSWKPPTDYWQALAVTGYQVRVWCGKTLPSSISGYRLLKAAAQDSHLGFRGADI